MIPFAYNVLVHLLDGAIGEDSQDGVLSRAFLAGCEVLNALVNVCQLSQLRVLDAEAERCVSLPV